MKTLQDYIDKLNSLNFKEMYNNDFFWTWDKTDEELEPFRKRKSRSWGLWIISTAILGR